MGIRGFSRRRRANDPLNRQIVKSTSPRQRDTRSGKWRSIIIRACSSERYVNPDLVPFPCELHKSDVYLWNRPYVYTYTLVLWRGASTHVRIVVQARAHELPVYTLKGGYIGFPVTTNLPRHRAIYISVESIASTKNQ